MPVAPHCPWLLSSSTPLPGGQHDEAAGFQTVEHVAGANILELTGESTPIPPASQFLRQTAPTPIWMSRPPSANLLQIRRFDLTSTQT